MRFRWLQSALSLFLLVVAPFAAVQPAVPVREAPEYTVKAAYVLLFTRYVEWPATAFAAASAPLEVLVLGADPFGEVLDATLAGMKSHGREIVVRRARSLEPGARAHVVFFGGADPALHAQWLGQIADAPMLSIVEESSDLAGDAVLTFVTETRRDGARVRFDVNLASMRRAGLRINSQMISSARKVVRAANAPEAGR